MRARLFIEREWIDAGSRRVRLPRDQARYLRTVLRLRAGAPLTLFDGSGREYLAVLRGTDRREATAEIVRVAGPAAAAAGREAGPGEPAPAGADRCGSAATGPAGTEEAARVPTPRCRLVLAQGLVKGDRVDLVVQKATELGASAIHPLSTRRAVPRPADGGGSRLARWRRIAVEAAEQCGRVDLPEVHPVEPLEAFLARPFPGALRLCFHEGAARGLGEVEPLRKLLRSGSSLSGPPRGDERVAAYPTDRTVVAMIGPEGGFDPDEAEAARAAGFRWVGLGPRVLRAETAALAALAVLAYELEP